MKNTDLIKIYIEGKTTAASCNHLVFIDDKLVNYSTTICIIDRDKKTALVNVRKYSVTTSKIQTRLKFELHQAGYTIKEYTGEDATAWNYGYMGAPKCTIDHARRYCL